MTITRNNETIVDTARSKMSDRFLICILAATSSPRPTDVRLIFTTRRRSRWFIISYHCLRFFVSRACRRHREDACTAIRYTCRAPRTITFTTRCSTTRRVTARSLGTVSTLLIGAVLITVVSEHSLALVYRENFAIISFCFEW